MYCSIYSISLLAGRVFPQCNAGGRSRVCCSDVSLARISATSIAVVFHWLSFQRHRASPCSVALVLGAQIHIFPMLFVAFHMCLAHVDGWSVPPIASLLWCFTGYHLDDFGLSGVSLATISLTRNVPMLRGVRPVCS